MGALLGISDIPRNQCGSVQSFFKTHMRKLDIEVEILALLESLQ